MPDEYVFSDNVLLIHTPTPGNVPSADLLSRPGRIGVNEADGVLFTRKADGTVRSTPLAVNVPGGLLSYNGARDLIGSVVAGILPVSLPLSDQSGAGLENAAILNEFFDAGGYGVVPDIEFEVDEALIPKSNATLIGIGKPKLVWTGSGGNVIENSSSEILSNFNWLGIGLDAADSDAGVLLHSPYNNEWDFGGFISHENDAGVLFEIIADVTTGSVNLNGNRNAAFNKVRNMILHGNGKHTGTFLRLGGTGTSTVAAGIATLNNFQNIGALDTRVCGIELGHWCDNNTFTGQTDILVNKNNGIGLWVNSSADTTKTVYKNTFASLSLAQYVARTGTIAIKLGASRTTDIQSVHFDYLSLTQFGQLISIDETNTASYRIVAHGGTADGDEWIDVWQRMGRQSSGPTSGLTQSLPYTFRQAWNNAAVPFTGRLHEFGGTYSAASLTDSWTVDGVSVANLSVTGTLNLAGGIEAPNANFDAVEVDGLLQFSGVNATGGGSAALGANCPAVTATAPYTWLRVLAADGSTVYLPAWK